MKQLTLYKEDYSEIGWKEICKTLEVDSEKCNRVKIFVNSI